VVRRGFKTARASLMEKIVHRGGTGAKRGKERIGMARERDAIF